MRNKLVKARPHSDQQPGFSIHQDDRHSSSSTTVVPSETASAATPSRSTPSKAAKTLHEHPSPRSTLTVASGGTINSAMSRAATTGTHGKTSASPRLPNRMNSTIRTVPSFDDRQRLSEEDSGTDGAQSHSTSRDSGFSSSLNSTTSMSSSISQQRGQPAPGGISKVPSSGRLKPSLSTATQDSGDSSILDPAPRALRTRPSFADFQRDSSLSPSATAASLSPLNNHPNHNHATDPNSSSNDISTATAEAHLTNSSGWDNSVGKAGLGKTGRVINRLVSDNEALKRDIQIERLRAEESRQAARLLEDKLERVVSDYESRLLEASVTKTLLARKERQVETLQDAVELERRRAADASSRERVWKEEMERAKGEAKRQVDEASGFAALCEGRYNAISSHWKEQGEEVRRKVGRVKGEVKALAAERKRDDEKIETLRELCDQQDGNIRELQRQKEEIERQFERYKAQQEEELREIKRLADEREREQERTLGEAREVLDKLRWALNVKEKIAWAQ